MRFSILKRVIRIKNRTHILSCSLFILLTLTFFGCATFNPRPIEEGAFLDRSQTKSDGKVKVTAAVLSKEESRELFGINLTKKKIQPIWLEIENNDKVPYLLFQSHLDPYYYSPAEVAYINRFTFSPSTNREMEKHFRKIGIYDYIEPGMTVSGFSYVHYEPGSRTVNITLLGPKKTKWVTFFFEATDMQLDYHKVAFDELYAEDEIVSVDEETLIKALKTLPCCATIKDGTVDGDPLNLVFIGDAEAMHASLVRRGWDETETLRASSGWRTTVSFIFGGRYRYSPISPLYVFGRRQDVAFQKARGTIHERNHFRLWVTPMIFQGKNVWIGQISRDIGVKFTTKSPTLTTHVIDPDVDGDRWYLIQDLMNSEGIRKIGFVGGVGETSPDDNRTNHLGDAYFTDGLRAVLFFSDEPVSYKEIEFLDWEYPPGVKDYMKKWNR
jgi:hypothetical protein